MGSPPYFGIEMRFRSWSYRFAEEVLNSKLPMKRELEEIINSIHLKPAEITRPKLNEEFKKEFLARSWMNQPSVFGDPKDPQAKIDFLKERIGVEVEFGHSSFLGIDLLKFQTLSYSNLDKIDVGVYLMATNSYQKKLIEDYNQT